ncbi:MAG TPA: hypothetical protein VGN12_12015 [Pirellulales bacterium]
MHDNDPALVVGAVLAVIAISTVLDLPPYTWIARSYDLGASMLGAGWEWLVRGLVAGRAASGRAMRRAWEFVGYGISKHESPSDQGE